MFWRRSSCVFCDIVSGETDETELKYEFGDFVIFKDKYPHARYHFQCVPKRHIKNLNTLSISDVDFLIRMKDCATEFVKDTLNSNEQFLYGFHRPPFNSVRHLHMHIVGPVGEIPFHIAFDRRFGIFIPVDKAIEKLREKHSQSAIR